MMGSAHIRGVSEKKIGDKNEFSLETLKLQGEKISLYLSTLEYYKC